MTVKGVVSAQRRVLVVVTGGIAACQVPSLLSALRDRGMLVRCVMTQSAEQFITPLTLTTLSDDRVYGNIFSQDDEVSMGHIRLSRDADAILVVPCTAHFMAKMACGLADDIASAVLLATDKPVLIAPAMNVKMWENPATQANLAVLMSRGVSIIDPAPGTLACGEVGMGRLADVDRIITAVERVLESAATPAPSEGQVLVGRRALVTSGPTIEDIDPVRFLGNRSSGRQGYAVAEALARLGVDVTLVSGPVSLPAPSGVTTLNVRSAQEMFDTCLRIARDLSLDIVVCVAAVADWTVVPTANKLKKHESQGSLSLDLQPTPDILSALSKPSSYRPRLVVGFAAETENVVMQAHEKRKRKGCDWICANDVACEASTMGGTHNALHVIADGWEEVWPLADKVAIARRLARAIATAVSSPSDVSPHVEKVM